MTELITDDVLHQVVNAEGIFSDIKVNNLHNKAENFAAILKNVVFKFQDSKTKSETIFNVILKFPNINGIFYSSMLNSCAFAREVEAYSRLFPDICTWQKQVLGRTKYEMPLAKCYYTNKTQNFFILENLNSKGFEIKPSLMNGLNFMQCKSVMKELATFHGVGYAYLSSFGNTDEFFQTYNYFKGMTRKNFDEMLKRMDAKAQTKKMFEVYKKVLQNVYPEETALLSKIYEFTTRDHPPELLYNFATPNEKFNVICHGDLWGDNMLFRSDENSTSFECKFIDLQLMKYCSPAVDLVQFFWVSASQDVLSNHMNELFVIYYEAFDNILQSFECEITFSLKDLLEISSQLNYLGFIKAIMQCMRSFYKVGQKKDTQSDSKVDSLMQQIIDLMTTADKDMIAYCMFRSKFADSMQMFD